MDIVIDAGPRKVNANSRYISLSLEASELLYEYGYKEHAHSKREHINRWSNSTTYNMYLQQWKRYMAGKSLKSPEFCFSKDLCYMMVNVIAIRRDNPILIRVVKELGDRCRSHRYVDNNFVIKTIQDDVDWKIDICDYKEMLFIKEKDNDAWREYKG